MSQLSDNYLQFENVTKEFPGVKALTDVSFSVGEGKVHALLGENGAGKSTLLKVLSGIYQPTSGTLRINGEEKTFVKAVDALESGVAIIYQELNLVPELSVAENIFLGQLPSKSGQIDRKVLYEKARIQLKRLGEDINPAVPLRTLSIGQCQMVEIAKALSRNAKIIAFDEPTSSLSQREIEVLFKVIRELRDEGKVILYVSHRMEEIFELCDSLTVFKDGAHVKTLEDIDSVTNNQLVKLMVGREIQNIYNYRSRKHGQIGLELNAVEGPGVKAPISMHIHQGEILGLFGLVGAGRSELTRLIFGAESITAGEILVNGEQVKIKTPIDAINAGITFCPEDRKATGIVPVLSVLENTNISARPKHLSLGCMINNQWELSNANKQVDSLNVKTPSLEQLMGNLSGGNQQKVILGRWLSTTMKVILLDEPTRGIDVGAKSEIYELIFALAERGVTVLVISSDLPEVMGISDRIIVMKDGVATAELERSEFSEETILEYAMLGKHEAA